MADILDIDQARAALGWAAERNRDRDAELLALYIPAVTQIVETALRRRWIDYTETWSTSGASPITTPWPSAVVASVKGGSVTLTGWSFVAGVLTISDTKYIAGSLVTIVAGSLPVASPVILAAGIILAQLWNADHQGRAAGTTLRQEPTESVPIGYAVPRRAEALLAPYSLVTCFA